MSRKTRRKKPVRNPRPKSEPARVNPPVVSREKEIKATHEEALAIAEEEGLDRSVVGDDPKPEDADLDALWEIVREARDQFRSAKDKYEGRERALDDQASKITEREESLTALGEDLDARDRDLTDRHAALDMRRDEISKRGRALDERETGIRRREVNAEQGFAEERREMLARIDEAREASRTEFAEKRRESEARWMEREKALDDREEQLAGLRRELENEKRRLGFEEEDLDDLRADLDNRLEQRTAASREEYEHRVRSLDARLEQARHDRDRHEATLRQREEADRKFGHRTPDEVLRDLDALRAEKSKLEATLAERPDADAAVRLAGLEEEREAWQAERVELRRQVSALKRRLAYSDNDACEREVQRDLITSLESQRQLLHQTHEDIRSQIEELRSRNDAQSAFPACMAIDEDPESRQEGPIFGEVGDLEEFVEDLRHRIASDDPRAPLYYTLEDLRSFVGGLAMGPLVLLQGISGTGKTSLPVAFARAVGTKAAVIEVQAGWRDPQDLVGHYNAFEKRFYEKEFLKALYRARTQRWRDAIHIVLLDEMNLSHPEQYFSDLLSALELRPEDRRLKLMPHSVEPAPALFDEGSKLLIPENVWFVGTANHDETTVDFADKTYDRSHVMQFPHRPEPFDIGKPPSPRPPISFDSLRKAFETAIRQESGSANKAIGFLDTGVRDSLARNFEVGWGPRFERQMRRYVPVVIAAGGTVGEATDHMLAMRLLRKLKNRHDNRPEHVEALKQRVEESWPDLDQESTPTRSVEMLDVELRRLGTAPENGE